MKRGESIAARTTAAIKQALLELIREINYPAISVTRMSRAADVGRSTFYKHYASKANVLVDIQRDMFDFLFAGHTSADVWLATAPPPGWAAFFRQHRQRGSNPFSLSCKLGSDLDYLTTHVTGALASTIEARLQAAFTQMDFKIALPLLARSVSATFSSLVMAWFTEFQSSEPERFRGGIHSLMQAQVCAVTGLPRAGERR